MSHREAWAVRLWGCNSCGALRLQRAGYSVPFSCTCGVDSWDAMGWVALDTVDDPRSGQRIVLPRDVTRVVSEEIERRRG